MTVTILGKDGFLGKHPLVCKFGFRMLWLGRVKFTGWTPSLPRKLSIVRLSFIHFMLGSKFKRQQCATISWGAREQIFICDLMQLQLWLFWVLVGFPFWGLLLRPGQVWRAESTELLLPIAWGGSKEHPGQGTLLSSSTRKRNANEITMFLLLTWN